MSLKPVIPPGLYQSSSGDGLPDQTGEGGKFLTTDGTEASWATLAGGGDVVASGSLSNNALIIGQGGTTVAETTTGTGILTALGNNVGSAGAPVVLNGALGTPSSGTLTNASGLPISTGVSGLGTGIATALAVNVGTAGAPVVNGGALGTPSSGTLTNCTGLPASGVSGVVKKFTVGFTSSDSTAVATGKVSGFFTCPNAGTISAWSFVVDAGTATVKVWKIASGTAKPTAANAINTSGVAIAANTAVRSTTVTDFTTTTVSANDIFAFNIEAISGVTEITFQLEITPS